MGAFGAIWQTSEYPVVPMNQSEGISPYRMGQITKAAGVIAEQLTHGKYLYNPTYHECEIVLELILESIKKCKDE